ncbi:MAG: pilus assembly protein TadG-related protein [Microterricola sp.]
MTASRGIAALAQEDGGIVVFVAMAIPVVMLFLALSVDIGNWWVHKRHLQLQVDAAALAGGALLGECFTDPVAANAAIQDEATRFGGGAGSSYNGQVGGANQGAITLLYQSKTYAAGSVGPDDTETQPPCDTANLSFDVKASEAGLPLIFNIPGLSDVTAINAHARVELKQVEIQEGMLPVAVPDLRFTYVFATFVNEVTGAALGTVQLTKSGTSGADQLWTTATPISVTIPSAHVGVRIRLVGGTDPNAACGTLYTECYDTDSTNGVVHIRGWSTGTTPSAQNVWLLPGSCAPDAYFATADCSAGIQAEVDLGALYPLTGIGVTADVWASVDGAGHHSLTPGSTSGLVTWTANTGLPIAVSGPHTVELNWSWEQQSGTWTGKTCTDKKNNPCKDEGTFGPVQRAFIAGGRSGPLRSVQVFESGLTSSGSNSFQTGAAHTLGVSLAVTGSLKVQSLATDPVIELRVTGSQNQSIDCDPAISNLRDEINQGCGPAYKINKTLACPAYNQLWSLPEPWECVKTQTGGAVGQVEHGMKDRILGGSNSCTAPINWPNYDMDDPRIAPLIITPFGTFSGSGNDIVPVIDFAAFYVVGWNSDPCPGAHVVPKGYIAGHFIKYAEPNPRGAGDTVCNRDALTPCVPVLTR